MKDLEIHLTHKIEATKKSLAKLEETLAFAQKKEYHFRVTMQSLWDDYGEANGVGTGDTVEEATQKATEDYQKVNNRTSLQARKLVFIVFPNGHSLRWERD